MLGGIGDVINAADDVGHVHVHVVDYHGQVVQGRAVGPDDDEIVDGLVLHLDPAEYPVLENGFPLGDHEPDDRLPSLGLQRFRLRGGDVRVAAVISPGPAFRKGLLPFGFQFFRQVVASVGFSRFNQGLGTGNVLVEPAGLVDHLFVPVHAHPLQHFEYGVDPLRTGAGGVGIFDAQEEAALLPAGEEPVEQARVGAADVQQSGGAGGKANAYGPGHGSLRRLGIWAACVDRRGRGIGSGRRGV